MYYRGLYNLSGHVTSILFSDDKGLPLFGAVMSLNRFKFLLGNIAFDDSTDRGRRWEHDRFAAFREFFELFNDNCSRYYTPNEFMSLDETLYPMRNQITFKQYNPDKPAKYGLLFKSLNSAGLPYLHRAVVYASKPTGNPDEYYIQGTPNYVKKLVTGLSNFVSLEGRNISMDRLYSSIPIARWLLKRNITVVGTLMSNRSGIPDEIKATANREINSTYIFWSDNNDLALSSYVVKTKSGLKNVLVLSTMRPMMGVTKDDGKVKPAIYKLYDFTKGGTDECDQRSEAYSVKPKSRKWTMVAFSYILDMSRINASTILSLNQGKDPRNSRVSSFDFGWELSKALCLPFITSRSTVGLTRSIQLKMELVTGKKIKTAVNEEPPKKRQRCRECIATTHGEGHKKAKENLPKMTSRCIVCKNVFCKTHLLPVCRGCQTYEI